MLAGHPNFITKRFVVIERNKKSRAVLLHANTTHASRMLHHLHIIFNYHCTVGMGGHGRLEASNFRYGRTSGWIGRRRYGRRT